MSHPIHAPMVYGGENGRWQTNILLPPPNHRAFFNSRMNGAGISQYPEPTVTKTVEKNHVYCPNSSQSKSQQDIGNSVIWTEEETKLERNHSRIGTMCKGNQPHSTRSTFLYPNNTCQPIKASEFCHFEVPPDCDTQKTKTIGTTVHEKTQALRDTEHRQNRHHITPIL